MAVGLDSPLATSVSMKPFGNVAAALWLGHNATAKTAATRCVAVILQ